MNNLIITILLGLFIFTVLDFAFLRLLRRFEIFSRLWDKYVISRFSTSRQKLYKELSIDEILAIYLPCSASLMGYFLYLDPFNVWKYPPINILHGLFILIAYFGAPLSLHFLCCVFLEISFRVALDPKNRTESIKGHKSFSSKFILFNLAFAILIPVFLFVIAGLFFGGKR